MTRPPLGRRADAAIVAALCAAAFWLRWDVNEPRTFVGAGDVANYFTVARNLAAGRGFVIDYVWSFLARPEGIPTPSNVWWMPLPSVLCALGMELGGSGYGAAQTAMIAVSSLAPLVVYLLGRDLLGCARIGRIGAALAVAFHLFLDQPCAPLSHGPYLVLASLALWTIARAARSDRWLGAAGATIAATQLARSDGILLLGTLAAALLLARRRPRPRALAALALGYALVMAPWWAHNLHVHGALMPSGPLRAALMRTYPEWYALPEQVTLGSYLSDGWGPVLAAKLDVGLRNLHTLATGMTTGAARRQLAWDEPAVVALMVLAWIGVLLVLRRRTLFVAAHAAFLWAFYSLLFTAVGPESFRTGMYSLYPFLLLCAAAALDRIAALLDQAAETLARPRPTVSPRRVHHLVVVLALVWIGNAHVDFARETVAVKAADIDNLRGYYDALETHVLAPHLLPDDVVMARNVHALHAHTDRRCVQIPFADAASIRVVARRFGARWLLLEAQAGRPWWPPALEHPDDVAGLIRVPGPDRLGDRAVALYRIEP